LQKLKNSPRANSSPSASIATPPSGTFFTQPFIPKKSAVALVLALKKHPVLFR
jgi:hypothetical protein